LKSLQLKTSNGLQPGLLDQFEHLTILEIEMAFNVFEILASIGNRLTTLRLSAPSVGNNPFLQVLKVFDLCCNLESLQICKVYGSIDLGVPFDAEKVGLKQLVLKGSFVTARGFVPLISRAPKLEEVIFNKAIISKYDINTLVRYVSMGMIFQNVSHFVYNVPSQSLITIINIPANYTPGKPKALELILALEHFAKNIISYCPLLQNADFSFDGFYYPHTHSRYYYDDRGQNLEPYKTEEKNDVAIFLRELRRF
jgi:hypothetical protein